MLSDDVLREMCTALLFDDRIELPPLFDAIATELVVRQQMDPNVSLSMQDEQVVEFACAFGGRDSADLPSRAFRALKCSLFHAFPREATAVAAGKGPDVESER